MQIWQIVSDSDIIYGAVIYGVDILLEFYIKYLVMQV
jgi:hypothetical protein